MGMTELAPCPGGRIYAGSVVSSNPRDNALCIIDVTQMPGLFGRVFDPARGDFCAAMNGDGNASAAHVTGCTWISGGGIFATFDRTVTSAIRINWFLYMAP